MEYKYPIGTRVTEKTGICGGTVSQHLNNGSYLVTWDDGVGNDQEMPESTLFLPDSLPQQYTSPVTTISIPTYGQATTTHGQIHVELTEVNLVAFFDETEVRIIDVVPPLIENVKDILTEYDEGCYILTLRIPTAKLLATVPRPLSSVLDLS